MIIPAHNMSEVITRCIDSVHRNDYDREKVDIYVVAVHVLSERYSGFSIRISGFS